jgi:hypothetical protein
MTLAVTLHVIRNTRSRSSLAAGGVFAVPTLSLWSTLILAAGLLWFGLSQVRRRHRDAA